VDRLAGVDLSPGMIERAWASGVYDELEIADLAAFLAGRPEGGADLIIAADAFVYLGDLRPVLSAVFRALAPGGLAVFTVESGEAEYELGETMRFRHSDAHIREAAGAAGLSVLDLVAGSTRREAGAAAPGRIVTLAKA
jgi:predicted TPR repeat methyltransferase